MPLFTLPLTQSWTIDVMFTTTNDPLRNCVDDTLNETVATLLQAGVVVPVTVLELHTGVFANSQTVMVLGLPPRPQTGSDLRSECSQTSAQKATRSS